MKIKTLFISSLFLFSLNSFAGIGEWLVDQLHTFVEYSKTDKFAQQVATGVEITNPGIVCDTSKKGAKKDLKKKGTDKAIRFVMGEEMAPYLDTHDDNGNLINSMNGYKLKLDHHLGSIFSFEFFEKESEKNKYLGKEVLNLKLDDLNNSPDYLIDSKFTELSNGAWDYRTFYGAIILVNGEYAAHFGIENKKFQRHIEDIISLYRTNQYNLKIQNYLILDLKDSDFNFQENFPKKIILNFSIYDGVQISY